MGFPRTDLRCIAVDIKLLIRIFNFSVGVYQELYRYLNRYYQEISFMRLKYKNILLNVVNFGLKFGSNNSLGV